MVQEHVSDVNGGHTTAQPSCALCRRRKVRCDRRLPCGNCTRLQAECVPSVITHAPRGRQGGRKRKSDHELLQRIAKLEGLITNVQKRTEASPPMAQCSDAITSNTPKTHDQVRGTSADGSAYLNHEFTPGFGDYLASPFWATLSQEINGLRDVLIDASDEEDGSSLPQASMQGARMDEGDRSMGITDSALFFASFSGFKATEPVPPHQLHLLCESFLQNVDPVFKILHAPSLRKYLQEGTGELNGSPGPRGLEALKMAVCYAAVVSMMDEECNHRTGKSKAALMAFFRAATEQALATADFVNTTELSTLQALTIFLAAVRTYDTRRLMWTLTSVAVRIAQAMCLHHEQAWTATGPFSREMRRRLWWQICRLDSQAALDRASSPIISVDSFTTRMPLNVDDVDLDVGDRWDVEERQGFTDMTFCLIGHETLDVVAQLNYGLVKDPNLASGVSPRVWDERIKTVIRMQQLIENKYLRHLNLARPFQWTTKTLADIVIAILWLVAYRPLLQQPIQGACLHLEEPGILGLSIEVLDRANRLHSDPAASGHRWLTHSCVQWHPLAVAAAELCVKTEGPAVERAWEVLVPAFSQASQHVADTEEGMLWRPVRKLMNQAQQVRWNHLSSRSLSSSVAPGQSSNEHCPQDLAHRHDDVATSFERTESLPGQPATASPISHFSPLDWTPWLAAASTSQEQAIDNSLVGGVDQAAWFSWESFVHDVQGQQEITL